MNQIKNFDEYTKELNSQILDIKEIGDFDEYGKHNISEMATFGSGKWGKTLYKAAVHGASTKDRELPHIHIYLFNERNFEKPRFNFEISIGDLISKDEINLICQIDHEKNIKRTNKTECSWEVYRDLEKEFKKFLFSKPTKKGYDEIYKDNLARAIDQWNEETVPNYEENGVNPMKEYFDNHNIEILDKYKDYFVIKTE